MKKKKETRGGTRQGSGAKPKYTEKTKSISFQVPISKEIEFREYCREFLDKLKVQL
jgi:hypothetical protein